MVACASRPTAAANHAGAQMARNSSISRLDGAMMSVDTSDPANPGAPRKLFELAVLGQPCGGSVRRDGRRAAVPLDCSRGPAGHAIDRPYQLAVRLGGTVAAVRTRRRTPRGIQNPPTSPRASCALGRRATSCVRPSGQLSCVRRPASRRVSPPNRPASVGRRPSGPRRTCPCAWRAPRRSRTMERRTSSPAPLRQPSAQCALTWFPSQAARSGRAPARFRCGQWSGLTAFSGS